MDIKNLKRPPTNSKELDDYLRNLQKTISGQSDKIAKLDQTVSNLTRKK